MILVSGHPDYIEGKFLLASTIQPREETGIRMGRSEAMEVERVCKDWNVEDIWAMVFNTTATNSGHQNGACSIYEAELLQQKLLWLACRHHVPELVLKAAFKSLFGESSGPVNPAFLQLRDHVWESLDTTAGINSVLNLKKGKLGEFLLQG